MSFSSFQFSKPILTKSIFEMVTPTDKVDNTVKINLTKNVVNIENKNRAVVELTVQLNKIGNKVRDNSIFYADFTMQALFSWKEDIPENQLHNFLHFNAPTLLLSYIRPLVATITAAAPIPQYNLPYVNLIDLFKEDYQSAKEK